MYFLQVKRMLQEGEFYKFWEVPTSQRAHTLKEASVSVIDYLEHKLFKYTVLGLCYFLVMFTHTKVINAWLMMASCTYILTLPDLYLWYILYFILILQNII